MQYSGKYEKDRKSYKKPTVGLISLSPRNFWGETDIENTMTGGADEKPSGDVAILFEHGMKAVPVSAFRTDLKLFTHLHIVHFIIHRKPHSRALTRLENLH